MSIRPSWIAITVLLVLGVSWADQKNPQASAAKPINQTGRFDLIRALNGEMVYVRRAFPMGTKGIVIKPDGTVTPDGPELETAVAINGSAARAGDRVRITDMIIKDKMIIFEINGGPVKKKKWYQRLEVGSAGGSRTIAPPPNELARGSFLAIQFDKFVPQLTAEQLKQRLAGVFDFNAKNAVEAYLEAIPPKAKQAIKDKKVLVGMNKQMVVYAIGQPERKIREKDADAIQYEEWIYGQPPAEVKFVRFVKDEVTRVEIMQVDGQKVIDTAKQIDLKTGQETTAQAKPAAEPTRAPTLRRPGEKPEVAVQPAPPNAETDVSGQPQPPVILSDPNAPGRQPKAPSEERVPQ